MGNRGSPSAQPPSRRKKAASLAKVSRPLCRLTQPGQLKTGKALLRPEYPTLNSNATTAFTVVANPLSNQHFFGAASERLCCYCSQIITPADDAQRIDRCTVAHTGCAFVVDAEVWAGLDDMEAQNVKTPQLSAAGHS
jgi:hypothetical protein